MSGDMEVEPSCSRRAIAPESLTLTITNRNPRKGVKDMNVKRRAVDVS